MPAKLSEPIAPPRRYTNPYHNRAYLTRVIENGGTAHIDGVGTIGRVEDLPADLPDDFPEPFNGNREPGHTTPTNNTTNLNSRH